EGRRKTHGAEAEDGTDDGERVNAQVEESARRRKAVQEDREVKGCPGQGFKASHPDEQDPQPQAEASRNVRRGAGRSGQAAQDAAVTQLPDSSCRFPLESKRCRE